VSAADGALAWKFRAAPGDRFLVEDGRFVSTWPVSGSVLPMGDLVYFAAGRSSFLDGGMSLYALEAATGQVVHHRNLKTPDVTVSMSEKGPNDDGALPAVLVSDGEVIGMRLRCFSRDLKGEPKPGKRLIRATTGFLDDSWFHRNFWQIDSTNSKWGAPWGNLILFNQETAFSITNPYSYLLLTLAQEGKKKGGGQNKHQKYTQYPEDKFPRGVDLCIGKLSASKKSRLRLPMQVRAAVLTKDRLVLAGWRDPDEVASNAVKMPGDGLETSPCLYVLDLEGKILKGYALPAHPVFDGMAAADGRLYVPLADGTVQCWGGK
jgi:hypothetical protein